MASSGSWMEVSVVSPMSSPTGGTQDHTGLFQAHLGQDLPQFTEPRVPVGHPERGQLKFVAAIFPLAAVQVQDMMLVPGEQLYVQVFLAVSQLPQTL